MQHTYIVSRHLTSLYRYTRTDVFTCQKYREYVCVYIYTHNIERPFHRNYIYIYIDSHILLHTNIYIYVYI